MIRSLELLKVHKKRYYRENLQSILKTHKQTGASITRSAIRYCLDKNVYNGHILHQVAQTRQKSCGEKAQTTPPVTTAQLSDYNIVPEKTDINNYSSLFQ